MLSFQIKPWVAFGLTYLLIELFYIGIPVVWTDGRSIARSMYGHVITKFYRMGRLPQLFSYGAPRLELRYHYGKLQNDYLYKLYLVVDFCVFTSQVMSYTHKLWSLLYQGS